MSMIFCIIAAAVLLGTVLLFKLALVASIIVVLPFTRGAMFHPSARIRVKTFLDNVPMKKGDLLIDIGCGDGRVLREANRRYGVRAVGFEINPLAYCLAHPHPGVQGRPLPLAQFLEGRPARSGCGVLLSLPRCPGGPGAQAENGSSPRHAGRFLQFPLSGLAPHRPTLPRFLPQRRSHLRLQDTGSYGRFITGIFLPFCLG